MILLSAPNAVESMAAAKKQTASETETPPGTTPETREAPPLDRLLQIMERLRDPETGCPWDKEQTFHTIAPYTIEEAYEVAEAIEEGDMAALKEELGDLLFQVVFYAEMGREGGHFDFHTIAEAIADKMTRRHPHVFEGMTYDTAQDRMDAWEEEKSAERHAKSGRKGGDASILDDVPSALPALLRSDKLQKRAARVGFDWPQAAQVLDKIEEEIAELRAEIDDKGELARQKDEIGDLFFALANLARHLKIDPESALRHTNAKFEHRFRKIETWLTEAGRSPNEASLEEMEALWARAKEEERS
jgi:ATP diphosphatase